MPIIVFGSLNHDIVTHTTKLPGAGETVKGTSFQENLGGKGFNEAVACAKLKSPNDNFGVKLFGCLGNDDVSKRFLAYLKKLDIDTNLIKIMDGKITGTATIIVDDHSNGENRIIVVPGANGLFHPSIQELDLIFKQSNQLELQSSIENPNLPSNLHSHASKPLHNEKMAKTLDINPHPPSGLHSHSSTSSLLTPSSLQAEVSSAGLANKNGNLIHNWSASGLNKLSNTADSSTHIHSSLSNMMSGVDADQTNNSGFHSHKPNDIMVSKITGSYSDSNTSIPSNLHSHASVPKIETLTYPSPKPSAIDLQNAAITLASKVPVSTSSSNLRKASNLNLTAQHRLTNVSFSLGGSSAHSSTASLPPSQSYLSMFNHRNVLNDSLKTDDFKYMLILQNEIPTSCKIINHIAEKFPNVEIFYNPSPLPIGRSGYNEDFSNALHDSHNIIVNEHELLGIVQNCHPNPDREAMTLLKNISNFEPNSEFADIVDFNINLLSKLRTLLTKPTLIVTLGPAGVLFSESGKFSYSYIPSEDVEADEILDTTGAGDTFLGAVATCLYRGEGLESAIKFATKASAETIKKFGAAESMPFYKDVEKRGWLL